MSFTVFVKPVNHMSRNFMENIFSEFGEIQDIYIPRTYNTKRRQNYAYVKFDDKHAAARAISSLDNKEVNGRVLSVQWAEFSPKTPEEMKEKNQQLKAEWEKKKAELPPISPEELEYKRNKKRKAVGPLHKQYFTAVDYPPGIGLKYTPVYQINLPPVGQRRTFFSWVYVPKEQIEKILKEEALKQGYIKKQKEAAKPQNT